MSIFSKMTAIANEIRAKTGKSDKLTLDDMASEIASIESGIDTSDATATANDILSGKTAYVNGKKITGSYEGVELNFDIKKYNSEEELLADIPAENTIGVVTTTPITGYKFNAIKPENMDDGGVWIYVGANSDAAFDIVNNITVYPLSAQQYVSGAWMDVTAMSWQGGEWIEWMRERYLYNAGDEFTDLTGGLEAHAIAYSSSDGYEENKAPIITRNASSIIIKHDSAFTDKYGIVRFKNKINLSKYKTLKFDGKLSGSRTAIYIWKSIGSYYHQNYVTYLTGAKSGEVSINIPSGTGECYIGFGVGYTESITLNKMWLEV